MIGQGLAAARGLNLKHATKQVDRLLSNPMINVDDILVRWVPYVVGFRGTTTMARWPTLQTQPALSSVFLVTQVAGQPITSDGPQ